MRPPITTTPTTPTKQSVAATPSPSAQSTQTEPKVELQVKLSQVEQDQIKALLKNWPKQKVSATVVQSKAQNPPSDEKSTQNSQTQTSNSDKNTYSKKAIQNSSPEQKNSPEPKNAQPKTETPQPKAIVTEKNVDQKTEVKNTKTANTQEQAKQTVPNEKKHAQSTENRNYSVEVKLPNKKTVNINVQHALPAGSKIELALTKQGNVILTTQDKAILSTLQTSNTRVTKTTTNNQTTQVQPTNGKTVLTTQQNALAQAISPLLKQSLAIEQPLPKTFSALSQLSQRPDLQISSSQRSNIKTPMQGPQVPNKTNAAGSTQTQNNLTVPSIQGKPLNQTFNAIKQVLNLIQNHSNLTNAQAVKTALANSGLFREAQTSPSSLAQAIRNLSSPNTTGNPKGSFTTTTPLQTDTSKNQPLQAKSSQGTPSQTTPSQSIALEKENSQLANTKNISPKTSASNNTLTQGKLILNENQTTTQKNAGAEIQKNERAATTKGITSQPNSLLTNNIVQKSSPLGEVKSLQIATNTSDNKGIQNQAIKIPASSNLIKSVSINAPTTGTTNSNSSVQQNAVNQGTVNMRANQGSGTINQSSAGISQNPTGINQSTNQVNTSNAPLDLKTALLATLKVALAESQQLNKTNSSTTSTAGQTGPAIDMGKNLSIDKIVQQILRPETNLTTEKEKSNPANIKTQTNTSNVGSAISDKSQEINRHLKQAVSPDLFKAISLYSAMLPGQDRPKMVEADNPVARLFQLLLGALAKVQTTQLKTLQQQTVNQDPQLLQTWTFEVPFHQNERYQSCDLTIEQYQGDDKDQQQDNKNWRILLGFELDEMGDLFIELNLKGEQASSQIWANNATAYKSVKEEVQFLRDSLTAIGVEVSSIDCHHGEPPDKNTHWGEIDDQIVDLHT